MKKIVIGGALILSLSSFGQTFNEGNRFQEADTNGDGVIQVNEVQRMIDGFFIGKHDRGVMYVHSLIDYFFEQP
jgi:hypothetical protein